LNNGENNMLVLKKHTEVKNEKETKNSLKSLGID